MKKPPIYNLDEIVEIVSECYVYMALKKFNIENPKYEMYLVGSRVEYPDGCSPTRSRKRADYDILIRPKDLTVFDTLINDQNQDALWMHHLKWYYFYNKYPKGKFELPHDIQIHFGLVEEDKPYQLLKKINLL